MDFTLEDLLPKGQQIRSVGPFESADSAIRIMHQHQYGQLPVITEDKRFQEKVVTFESILQAVQAFDTPATSLQVRDVATRIRSYRRDADLLATLEDIHRDDFVMIADEAGLHGIVTTADLALFFREYAQDLMVIDGIESRIKDAIRALYSGDEDGLSSAIVKASDRGAQLRKKLSPAIGRYLEKVGLPRVAKENEAEALQEAERVLGLVETVKEFDELTLDEFVTVLLSHQNSPKLTQSKDASELRGLLDRVREARNTLAHFKRELSLDERRTIQFADEWLENNLPVLSVEAPSQTPIVGSTQFPPDEENTPNPMGSYAPLAAYLQSQPNDTTSLSMTFQQIEGYLEKDLPRSASEHRAWWSNDPLKPQSAAWLDEGWRTASVSMSERRLTFVRTDDREKAYISFFASLNAQFSKSSTLAWRSVSPQGQSWHELVSLDRSRPEVAKLFAAFTRRKLFRVELYLDTGEKESTKLLFDQLYMRKDRLESIVGEEIHWERLDEKRACRIAVYTKAQIWTDMANVDLIEWAVRTAVQLRRAFEPEFAAP